MSTDSPDNPSQGTSSGKTNGRKPGSGQGPAARSEPSPSEEATSRRSTRQASPSGGDGEQPIGERARQMQHRLEESYHELEQRYGDVRSQAREINDRAVDFIRNNPVVCIAGAVGVGYLVGRLASRRWLE